MVDYDDNIRSFVLYSLTAFIISKPPVNSSSSHPLYNS